MSAHMLISFLNLKTNPTLTWRQLCSLLKAAPKHGVRCDVALGLLTAINTTFHIIFLQYIRLPTTHNQSPVHLIRLSLSSKAWAVFLAIYAKANQVSSSDVWSIASPFVASCPSSNPVLPFTAHSPLVATVPNAPSGTNVTYSFNSTSPGPFYAAYLYGIDVKTVPLSYTQTATVPDNLLGTYYTVIVSFSQPFYPDAQSIHVLALLTHNRPLLQMVFSTMLT